MLTFNAYNVKRLERKAARKLKVEKGLGKAALIALFKVLAGISEPEAEPRFVRFRLGGRRNAYGIGTTRKLARKNLAKVTFTW